MVRSVQIAKSACQNRRVDRDRGACAVHLSEVVIPSFIWVREMLFANVSSCGCDRSPRLDVLYTRSEPIKLLGQVPVEQILSASKSFPAPKFFDSNSQVLNVFEELKVFFRSERTQDARSTPSYGYEVGKHIVGLREQRLQQEVHPLKLQTIGTKLEFQYLLVSPFASIIGNPHLQYSERSRNHCEDTSDQALEIVKPVSPRVDGINANSFATRVHNVQPERRIWNRDGICLEKKKNENCATKKQNYSIGPFRSSQKKCPSINFVSHSTRSFLKLKQGYKRWQFAGESKRSERLSPHSGEPRVAELRAIS